MSWRDHFKPLVEYFASTAKSSGKLIDIVRFIGKAEDKLTPVKNSIAILSLQEPVLSSFSDSFHMHIRRRYYDLYASLPKDSVIYDLGYHTLSENSPEVFSEMFNDFNSLSINVIILSSVKNANTLLYNTIRRHYKSVAISEASPELPLSNNTDSCGFKEILADTENNLFNYTNIGMQSFLNSTINQDLFRKLLFDTFRMGVLQKDLSQAEPVIRDSHIFSFDFNSIKSSDAPAAELGNPTGFSSFDACRISRFAGVAEKNRIFCLNRLPQNDDTHSSSSFLSAQMLWFYTDGFYNRIIENPGSQNKNFNKFITETEEYGTLAFYQSQQSDRWWVQLDPPGAKKMTVSCLKGDYMDTLKGEIPDKFVKLYQKLL